MSSDIEMFLDNNDNSRFNLNNIELKLGSSDSKITEITPMTLKSDLLHFKDELLKDMKIFEKTMLEKQSKLEFLYKNEFPKISEQLTTNNQKLSELSNVVFVQERIEKQLSELLTFKKKIDDYTITNDIKFSNLEKDSSDNIYRINSILRDTILYPGIIGATCKFKNFHDFMDYLLNETSNFNSFREKSGVELSLYKSKISKTIGEIKSKIENINKANNIFTRKVVNQCEERLSTLLLKYDEQINTSRIQCSKLNSDLEQKVENLINEIKKVDDKLSLHYKEEYFPLKDRFNLIYSFVYKEDANDNKENNNNVGRNSKSAVDFKTKKKLRNSIFNKNADIMSNLSINLKKDSKNITDEEKNAEKKLNHEKNENTEKSLNTEKNLNAGKKVNIEESDSKNKDNIGKDINNEKNINTEKSATSKKDISSSSRIKSINDQTAINDNDNTSINIKEIEKLKNDLKIYLDTELKNLQKIFLNQIKHLIKIKNKKTEQNTKNKQPGTEIDDNCRDFINKIIRDGIFNLHENPNSSKAKFHSVENFEKNFIQTPESFIDVAYKNIKSTNLTNINNQKRYSLFISPEKKDMSIMDIKNNIRQLKRKSTGSINNFWFGKNKYSKFQNIVNSQSTKVLSFFDENNPYTRKIKSGLTDKKNNNTFSSIRESSSDNSDKKISTEEKEKKTITIDGKIKNPIQLSPISKNKNTQINLSTEKSNKVSDKKDKNSKPSIVNKTTYMNFPKINNTKENKIVDLHPLYRNKRFNKYISPYIVAITNNIQACFEKSEKIIFNKNLREQKKLLYNNSEKILGFKNKYNKNNENINYGIKHNSPGYNMLKSIDDKELLDIIQDDLKKRQEKKITNIKLNKNNRFSRLRLNEEKVGFINLKTKV